MGRIWGLAALIGGIWLLSVYGQSRPVPLGLDAPAGTFSAARADAVLSRLLGDQKPRPAGSPENEALRARLLKELAALGVSARTQTGMSCADESRRGFIPCATVSNIIADVSPGRGKRIVLMAHLDSVAAGPGAGDDMSGVATIVETIRALKARGLTGEHPITALFTDGEESGLLGARAYLKTPLAAVRTGAVINVEARGNQGPSYLFQTSPGDAKLIDLYAASVPRFAASSLYAEIYKILPNDTDLTPFLRAGITGFNFAFIGNAAHYHTPLDQRENIDPRSLQQHGDNLLELADTLSRTDLDSLGGSNAIYLDVLGRWLPRLPASWALPLSLAAFLLIGLAGFLTPRERREARRPVQAFFMPPLMLAGAVGTGFVLHFLAAWISGHADPSFAHPVWLRLSLAFGAFGVALMVSRGAGSISCWLWLSGLAVVCAVFAPGLTPYFLFPSLVAAPLLLVTIRGGRGPALFFAMLSALVIWIGFNAASEPIMGLKMYPLFMITAAFGLIAALPLLTKVKRWGVSCAVSLVLALVLAITAGLQPAYSGDAPQRINLRYAEIDGTASWLADPVPRLPDGLRAAANFSTTPQSLPLDTTAYVAPAGAARYPVPTAEVSRSGDVVTLDLKTDGDMVMLVAPPQAGLQSVTVAGVATKVAAGQAIIACSTPDCAKARVSLRLSSSEPLELMLVSQKRGLPSDGAKLLKARGADAVPQQQGDRIMLVGRAQIPGR
jgi:hypothetical protein